jgi:hypothetical protein
MIKGNEDTGFILSCDYCNDECDEEFDTFQDAVDYKKERENGWRSVTDKRGRWNELCPACATSEIINKLKGSED